MSTEDDLDVTGAGGRRGLEAGAAQPVGEIEPVQPRAAVDGAYFNGFDSGNCHRILILTYRHSYSVSLDLGWYGPPGSPQPHFGMGVFWSTWSSLVCELMTAMRLPHSR